MGWTMLIAYCVGEDGDRIDLQRLKPLKSEIMVSTQNGNTPLHFVALGKNIQLARWLINHGAKAKPNKESQTPLHWACKNGNKKMIKLLLCHMTTSQIQQVDEDDKTAFAWLLEFEHFGSVGLFNPKILYDNPKKL